MYTTRWCPFCVLAKRLLSALGATVEEIPVDIDPARREEMVNRSGRRTVPQIFVDDRYIGGFEEVAALDRGGKLRSLITSGEP